MGLCYEKTNLHDTKGRKRMYLDQKIPREPDVLYEDDKVRVLKGIGAATAKKLENEFSILTVKDCKTKLTGAVADAFSRQRNVHATLLKEQ